MPKISVYYNADAEYIQPPVSAETLAKRRVKELEDAVRNLHKVRGRHHTQQACDALFALVGLDNNIGE